MGLTIHYTGKLKNANDLKSLIDAVKDVAIIEKWNYFIFEEQFENNSFSQIIDRKNLYGIMITPPESEPLSISFLSNGRMSSILNFNVMQLEKEIKEKLVYAVFTKTQYTGYENHKKLILLLDFINKNYLEDFECKDDGYYWETRDEDLLKKTFEKYTHLSDSFSSSIEMIPMNEGEHLEYYLLRMTNNVTNSNLNEVDLLKLSVEEENEYKKIKLSLEHDAIFPDMDSKLPPEIESQFLDSIINFEKMYENVKKITVYEKIGKPHFKKSNLLNDNQISHELEKIEGIMHNHNLSLDVICEYEEEERLIYTFITEELFEHEIDDVSIPGMITHFTYEDFHQNHEHDIENSCNEFITIYFDIEDDFYERFHASEAKNHEELNTFRSLFKKLEIKHYQLREITRSDDYAKASLVIEFCGKIKGSENKINYSGYGEVTFKYEFGFWYIQNVILPIKNH